MNAASLIFFVVAVFFAALASASAVPLAETESTSGKELATEQKLVELVSEYVPVEGKSRLRRATCDLLSVDTPFGSLNHSACAAHCLAMRKGFKGGRCMNGVCHCRK